MAKRSWHQQPRRLPNGGKQMVGTRVSANGTHRAGAAIVLPQKGGTQ